MLEPLLACAIILNGIFVLSLISNTLWIMGLALLLASFSYHYYEAQRHKRQLREQLRCRSFVMVAWVSLTLIGLGLAGTSQQGWEAALWILLTLMAGWRAVTVWRAKNGIPED
jgi:hypothetical protein